MITVWKYRLHGTMNTLDLPLGAKVLHVDDQDGVPTCWVQVDSNERRREQIAVFVVGTGTQVPNGADYVNTFMVEEFVFHAYTNGDKLSWVNA